MNSPRGIFSILVHYEDGDIHSLQERLLSADGTVVLKETGEVDVQDIVLELIDIIQPVWIDVGLLAIKYKTGIFEGWRGKADLTILAGKIAVKLLKDEEARHRLMELAKKFGEAILEIAPKVAPELEEEVALINSLTEFDLAQKLNHLEEISNRAMDDITFEVKVMETQMRMMIDQFKLIATIAAFVLIVLIVLLVVLPIVIFPPLGLAQALLVGAMLGALAEGIASIVTGAMSALPFL